jgi:hypothetical protein
LNKVQRKLALFVVVKSTRESSVRAQALCSTVVVGLIRVGTNMLIKDARLWDGTTEVYLRGYPFALACAGEEAMSGHTALELDRRLVLAITHTGLSYLLYRHPGGFKKITLKDEQ